MDPITLGIGASIMFGVSSIAQRIAQRKRVTYQPAPPSAPADIALSAPDDLDPADNDSNVVEDEFTKRRLARWERDFLLGLKARTGRALNEWMVAISKQKYDDRIATLTEIGGLSTREAIWMANIFCNGGTPLYCAPDAAYMAPLGNVRAMQPVIRSDDRLVAPVKAAEMLINYMQRIGATGYFTRAEIDAYWSQFSTECKVAYLHPNIVRSELAAIPNVKAGCRRLNMPEFRVVRARNPELERVTVYRIPSEPVHGRTNAGGASARDRHGAGKLVAKGKKRILTGPDAWSGGEQHRERAIA